MLFKDRFFPDIESGEITLTFRTWTRPQVKEGGRYRFNENGALDVIAVRSITADDISDSDAKCAGFDDRESVLAFVKPRDDRSLYRIEFRFVADARDERAELSSKADLGQNEVAKLAARFDNWERVSSRGPWAWRTLDLIAKHPRVRAPDLAAMFGWETQPFKANVRKLKALGLTISHEVGYELSPRGRAFLTATKARGRK